MRFGRTAVHRRSLKRSGVTSLSRVVPTLTLKHPAAVAGRVRHMGRESAVANLFLETFFGGAALLSCKGHRHFVAVRHLKRCSVSYQLDVSSFRAMWKQNRVSGKNSAYGPPVVFVLFISARLFVSRANVRSDYSVSICCLMVMYLHTAFLTFVAVAQGIRTPTINLCL
jgi:hypothetical protein